MWRRTSERGLSNNIRAQPRPRSLADAANCNALRPWSLSLQEILYVLGLPLQETLDVLGPPLQEIVYVLGLPLQEILYVLGLPHRPSGCSRLTVSRVSINGSGHSAS